jgi:hypothetical protein
LVTVALAYTALSPYNAPAAIRNWQGANNAHWSDAGNWNPNFVPTALDDVYINNATTCVIDQYDYTRLGDAPAECYSLHLGTNQGQSGSLTVQAGGQLTIGDGNPGTLDDNLYVGEYGSGTLTIQGDPQAILDGGWVKCYGTVYAARFPDSTAAINVSGNGWIDPQVPCALWAGTDMHLGGYAALVYLHFLKKAC